MTNIYTMKRYLFTTLAAVAIWPGITARQPQKGYRGFVEWSNSVRWEKTWLEGGSREILFHTGFTTSHGYQINRMFFVGAGLGMERCGKTGNWIAPVFIDGRIDLRLGKFTPFGDIRAGCNLASGAGLYLSPSIGYRFNWGRKAGINIGAALTLAGYKSEHYECWFDAPGSLQIQYVGTRHHMRPYFSFRLGLDF